MPMSRWRRLVITLRMRYHIKRYFLTLVIPSILGVALIVYTYHIGFWVFPNLNQGSGTAVTPSATLVKLAEFYALSNETVPASVLQQYGASTGPDPHNLDLVFLIGAWIALGPYSVDTTLRDRKFRQYEQDFTDFLFELSELVRGGIDPVKATITLSEGNLGSITNQVRLAAKQMQIGYTFEQAMQTLGDNLKSPLAEKYTDLVVQASYSGGSVANLIQRASADMGIFLAIDREKRAGLSQYTVILYMAQVILIVLCAILVVQFLPSLAGITGLVGAGSSAASDVGGLLSGSDIGKANLERDFYLLVEINGFLGGLVIGKISEGKVSAGLKHGLILMLIGFLAWNLFVVPNTQATQTYTVTPISYDHTGYASLPLQDDVTVRVTNAQGQPVSDVSVSFAVSGGGSALPTAAVTDSNGTASTSITLGSVPGQDVITASCGSGVAVMVVTAASEGGGA